jgi:multidrug transporter EmrE-like cation transporter
MPLIPGCPVSIVKTIENKDWFQVDIRLPLGATLYIFVSGRSSFNGLSMETTPLPWLPWLIFLAAAVLEVGGDALIRKGLRASAAVWIIAGCALLATYGLVVNVVKWDFSKLLGIYVAVFAVISVLAGRFLFAEDVPLSTWIGLGIIVLGGLVIQFGQR